MDICADIPHSKAHPQTTGALRKQNLWKRSVRVPDAGLGAIWTGYSCVLGTWNMGGWCRLWLDMFLGATSPSLHGDNMEMARTKAPITQLYRKCWYLRLAWYLLSAMSVVGGEASEPTRPDSNRIEQIKRHEIKRYG